MSATIYTPITVIETNPDATFRSDVVIMDLDEAVKQTMLYAKPGITDGDVCSTNLPLTAIGAILARMP